MNVARIAFHQFRYDSKVFWRNPAAVFFTVLLPLVFLVIFSSIFGDDLTDDRSGVSIETYYVPAIATLAVISATLVNLAIRITEEREAGILKRVRGTPLPAWAFIAGRVGNSLVISFVMVIVVSLVGWMLYGVELPTATLPALIVTLTLGAAAFCCLGIALTALIPSEDAAPAITNATVLPLYFLSGVFIPDSEIPEGILSFASIFPIRHFFEAFFTTFDPMTSGSGLELGHLAVVAGWGLGGLVAAVLAFKWTPRGG